jgi:hypothetical protein
MIEVIGQYTSAKIFTENIEQEALSQIYEVCSHPIFNNSSVRIMPDCLTEDTEVLTKTGYKLISQLTYTDSIANYDPGTSKVHFRTPKDIIVREVKKDEDIYSFNYKVFKKSITTSENHRMAFTPEMGLRAKDLIPLP